MSSSRNTIEMNTLGQNRKVICVDHIAVAVEDLDESIAWYRDNLGFELQDRRITKGKTTSMSSAVMRSAGATVVLVQGNEPESSICRFIDKFGPGVQHIAFQVSDLNKALKEFVTDEHPEDTKKIEGDGIRQVFLKRTNGSAVRVELIERNGGDFSDESVQELYRSFEERDLF